MRGNSRTFVTLFYWLKFLGLNPLRISKSNELEFSYFGLIYGCLLIALGSYVLYGIIIERSKMLLPGDSPIDRVVEFGALISSFFESTLTWLSFRFFQNRLILVVGSFSKARRISTELGISQDSDKRLRNLGLILLFVNCVFIIWMMFNSLTTKNYSSMRVFTWILFYLMRMSSMNMITIFLWSFLTVKQSFRQLNDKVRFVMRNSSESSRRSSGRTIIVRIETISRLHRQLRDTTDRLQDYCGGFVACDIATSLMFVTIDIHIVYRFLKRHNGPMTLWKISYILNICEWILLPLLLLTVISNICGSLSDEANETGNILHATMNSRNNFSDETAAKCHLLSMELLKNRVKISLLGCLDLDQFFVYSAIGTATTYLVIMLQFYN